MSSPAFDSRSLSAQSDDTCSDTNSVVARAQRSIGELLGPHVHVRFELSSNATPVGVPTPELEKIVLGLCRAASGSLAPGRRLLVETRGTNDPPFSAEADALQERRTRIIVRPEPHGGSSARAGSSPPRDLLFCKLEHSMAQLGVQLELVQFVGQGIALIAHLPAAPLASSARLAVAAPHEACLILLVEDEPQVQAVTARILRAFGYEVVTAKDEPTALAQADQYGSAIGLVVSDLLLPGVSGKDLVRRLRTPCEHAGVLYISGYSPEHVGALADGAQFLRKPFTAQELLRMVRGLMQVAAR